MEGRLTNLEQHQVRTGSQTIGYGDSKSITLPGSTFLYAIEKINASGWGNSDYGNCSFNVSASLSRTSDGVTLSLYAGNVQQWSATIVYAYYA